MGFMVVLSFTASNIYALLWQQSTWLVGAVLPAVVIAETNKERGSADLPPLQRNPVLDEAARLKAEHMAREGYFAHYSPTGVSPWHWFSEVDYRFVNAGENLAVHFTDSDEVVEAWMKSPTHRANIVNTSYREIGVGTAKGRYEGRDTVFVVQLFGSPAATGTVADAGIAVLPQRRDSLAIEAPTVAVEPEVAGIETDAETPVVAESATALPIDDSTVTPGKYPVTEIAEAVLPDASVVLYSDTLTTTTDAVPAELVPIPTETTAPMAGIATSPSRVLQTVYLVLGGLVAIALITSLIIEWRRHRTRQVVYGVLLLGLMSLLFWIHTLVSSGVEIV